VIDAAANPSVLAGVDGLSSSRQLVEHNLGGTVNLLEYCKRHRAGLILLSTSRVYSIAPLAGASRACGRRLRPGGPAFRTGWALGVSEAFPTSAPVSLYGATKLASEALALEYGQAFDLPVFINRCGILAGAGQFGRPDQGIFAFWINSHLRRRPLKYIGFGGKGPPGARLPPPERPRPASRAIGGPKVDPSDRIVNVGGGVASAMSLCSSRRGATSGLAPIPVGLRARGPGLRHPVDRPRCLEGGRVWGWRPRTPVQSILEEIAAHAGTHPDWLEVSAPFDEPEPLLGRHPRPRRGGVAAADAARALRRIRRAKTCPMRLSSSTTGAGTRPGGPPVAKGRDPDARPVQNPGPNGFGRAVTTGSTTSGATPSSS
jgi:CDP-paratose 2-epimerase